jgi:uncharacterized membrane protein
MSNSTKFFLLVAIISSIILFDKNKLYIFGTKIICSFFCSIVVQKIYFSNNYISWIIATLLSAMFFIPVITNI